MDEEISIIDDRARSERVKNFIIKNKIKILILLSSIILIIFSFFGYSEYINSKRKSIAEQYNLAVINYDSSKKTSKNELINIINKKDKIYSPLALYFLIDNDLVESQDEINQYFDKIILEVKLENEIKNLIIYKKALFNSGNIDENELIKILDPIVKSDSIWKPHALYLLAEYFFNNEQKQKAKEFYQEIILLKNNNNNILREVQKRLQSEYNK